VLHISPDNFDAEGTAAVIVQAIGNAARARNPGAAASAEEAKAAAHALV
jgi:hypothetical protein